MTRNNISPNDKLILIVDDDASIRMTAAGILETQNYSTLEADSAEACLSICQEQLPKLILLDAVMPGMDGFSCAVRLKSILGLQCPPIFMMTTLDDRNSIYRSFDVGITDYLLKPLNWTDLIAKIEKSSSNKAKNKELRQQFTEISTLRKQLQNVIYQTKGKIKYV
ncbi:MAG: response regulator [Cyanobacteria bacterium P01_C01_bin.72]